MLFSFFDFSVADVEAFVRQHQYWAPYLGGLIAFLESLPGVSLFFPGWLLLSILAGAAGISHIDILPLWIGVFSGAVLGDWVSYLIGLHFKESIFHVWPLSRYPNLRVEGHAFFERWGWGAVFLGRFFGPLRAIVPLLAGIFFMPHILFQIANVASAFLWSLLLMLPSKGFMAFF
jgi:membrane protein DedA with SNARE-associated domain